jgi:hypothetical protein
MMRGAALILLAWLLALIVSPAMAQQGVTVRDAAGNDRGANVNASRQLSISCDNGCAGGTFNNNADAIPTSATNGQTAAWLYGFNGATWDRLRLDGAFNLNVNCVVGCAGGTFNNNADNVATSATNGQAAAWLYVWDSSGGNWDRLYGDSTNGAWVNCKAGCSAATFTDTAAFTFGSTSINTIGGVYSTNPAPLASGTAGAALLTQGRILETASFASNGVEIGSTLRSGFSPPLQVNQSPLLAIPKLVPPLNAISDGKNIASFAGPNTVADASKPALVTALSPTTPLPAGPTPSVR